MIINEIQIGKGNNEFIELYNSTNGDVNLDSFKLSKIKSGTESSLVPSLKFKGIIKSKEYFLISHPDYNVGANLTYSSVSYYITTDTSIILCDKSGNILDSVAYGSYPVAEGGTAINPPDGKSIGRKDFIDTDDNSMDFSITEKPTPGAENIFLKPKEPVIYSNKIRINEILPNASEEFIELYNSSDKEVDLKDWKLKDASKAGEYIFPESEMIKAGSFLVAYKKDYGFALNNSGGETLTLSNPSGEIVSSVGYNGSTKEKVSFNFDGVSWRWSNKLTPGAENILNDLPEAKIKKDNKAYVGMYINFSAKTKDKNNDSLKYAWDFGDGHKSYLKNTKHKFEKAGKYKVILKVFDGSEEKIEEFDIKVEKYPRLKIQIESLSPNPKGKDTDGEYIILTNKSKKKANLNGWSVATGWDKLTNHPISSDFILNPGEAKKLTREFSKFTLNNKKSKVELRYPDGEVASKAKYKKKEGIKDDEIYSKKDKQWKLEKTEVEINTDDQKEEEMENSEENIPEEEEIIIEVSEEEIQANLGKFSREEKEKNKMALLNYGAKIKSSVILNDQSGIILGASVYRENNISQGSNFFEKANYWINRIITGTH